MEAMAAVHVPEEARRELQQALADLQAAGVEIRHAPGQGARQQGPGAARMPANPCVACTVHICVSHACLNGTIEK
jgi:hypothetical protein